ncbi:MAG: UPF0182 family protein [Actinomycetota bacterium]
MSQQPARVPQRRGTWRPILIAIVFGLVVSISTIVAFYTDLLWYREVGFQDVFWKILRSKLLLGAVFGFTFFVLAAVNLLIVGRSMPSEDISFGRDPLARYRAIMSQFRVRIALGASALLGIFFALGVSQQWERFILATNSVPFGKTDPVFNKDLGFYVFKLPMLRFAYGWMLTSVLVILILVAAAHFLTGGIRPQATVGRVSAHVKAHLSVLVGLFALLRAWGYRLDQYQLLFSSRGKVVGASYTDLNAELPALKLLVVISIIAAALFLVNIRFKGWTLPVVGVGLWFLTSVLGAGLFPVIIQRFQVAPAQLQKERPFIKRNIEATRDAYGLSDVEVREFPAKADVTPELVQNNRETLNNVRLFKPSLVRSSFSQGQTLRKYYKFNDVDVDRYVVGDAVRQVMISARELDPEGNVENPNWQNQHLFYTHGYGAVASLTNSASSQGEPILLLRDIPPETSEPSLKIDEGGLYFGEQFADYSVVRTGQKELDYVQGDKNRTTQYQGKGGVSNSSMLRRLAFAWRFREPSLLISGLIKPDSKIIYHRQIQDRLNKSAPFLSFDQDPYPVVVGGRIVWMADGYTTTSMFPYSERIDFAERRAPIESDLSALSQQRNYIRNSVKATVDAYDGTVTLYTWDSEQDPIIRAWQKAFPALFKERASMPEALQAHVRYPEDLFRIQTHIYAQYHVTDEETFFFGEDRWGVPVESELTAVALGAGDAANTTSDIREQQIQPYNVLMRLPGDKKQDFALTMPMNPRNRSNMVSWISAKSDPAEYGKFIDFRFPKSRQIDGVGQIHSRMNQEPTLSKEITLLNATGQGSKIEFGNILVIPLGESLLYVQPIFLQSAQNPRPELKFVVVATAERIAFATTFDEALQKLVGGSGSITPAKPDGSRPPSGENAVKEALDHLVAADDAARRGDWATYGKEQELAKDSLRRAAEPSPSPSSSP